MTSKTEIVATYDLPYTIDGYSTFPPHYMYESYTCDDDGNEQDNWSVDYKKYIEMLAWKCADYILEKHDAITKTKVISTYSPKYYNYTTDSADIEIEFFLEDILQHAECYPEEFSIWCNEFTDSICTPENATEKDQLLFYIHNQYYKNKRKEDYLLAMYDDPDYDLVIWDDDTSLVDRDE